MLAIFIDVFWLLALLLALWAPGELVLRALGARVPESARQFAPTLALGIGAWCLLLFALAALGLFHALLLRVLFGVAALAGVWRAGVRLAARGPGAPRPTLTEAALAAVGGLATALVLALAAYPSVGWDDAVYHLRLPAHYLAHGGFDAPRFLFFAHWPQNLELLFGLAMAVRGFVLAKLLHAACGVLLAAATYRLARRVAGPAPAWGAALLVAASPLVLQEARVAYVDLALAFFFVLAFHALLDALDNEAPRRHLALAGVFLGIGAGIKMTAWLGAAVLAGLWMWRGGRRGARVFERARDVAWLVGPAVLLALPWHLRSWSATGNPVYPLLWSVFGGPDWSAELAGRFAAWQRGIGMGRAPADYLLLPWRVFNESGKGYERFDGALGRHWLVVALFAAALGWRSPLARRCLAAAAGLFALWAAGPQQTRFLLPLLPLLAAAGAAAAVAAGERLRSERLGAGFAAAAALLLLLQLVEPGREAWRQLAARRQHGAELAARLVPPPLR